VQEVNSLVYILNSFSQDEASHFWHVIDLLEEMAERGVCVFLIVEKGGAVPAFRHPGIRAVCLQSRCGIARYYELLKTVRKALQSNGRHAIYTRIAAPSALVATLACLGTSARSFYWQSGTVHEHDMQQPWSLRKLRWYVSGHLPFRLLIRFVHRFVTGPESMVEYYRDKVGVPAHKLRLLYNDINLERFKVPESGAMRAVERQRLGIGEDDIVLLFVHRLSPVRRTAYYLPRVVIDAASSHEANVVCIVAGDGPDLPAVQSAVAELPGARFQFLGAIPNREIQRLYAVADIFLHPTYNEGFPRVVLEAMAAELPIVSTDAGGTSDVVGPEQRRYVVPRADRAAFSRCLRRLIEDAAERRLVGQENSNTVQRFATPDIAAMYERVLFE
jgi:glycosyltransferase involved in cell wall biosynthesis